MLCIIEHLVCVIIVIIIISISYIGYGTVETKALRGNRCTMGIFLLLQIYQIILLISHEPWTFVIMCML